MTTRRDFLTLLGSIPVGLVGCTSRSLADAGRVPEAMLNRSDEANLIGSENLDEALEMLAPYGPSFRGGLSNPWADDGRGAR